MTERGEGVPPPTVGTFKILCIKNDSFIVL